jgi:dihydroneopterin aldolase
MEVELAGAPHALVDTVDYAELAQAAATLGRESHIDLLETYAEQLADLCLSRPAAVAACVEVCKPRALSSGMAAVRICKRLSMAKPSCE